MLSELSRKTWFRRTAVALVLVCIAVILELLLSNYRNLFIKKDAYQRDVNADAPAVTMEEIGYSASGQYATYAIKNAPQRIYAVRLALSLGEKPLTDPVRLVLWGTEGKKTDSAVTLCTEYVSFGKEAPDVHVIHLDYAGVEGESFYATFYNVPSDAVVEAFVLNPTAGTFRFHGGRFFCFLLVIAAVLSVRYLSLHREFFDFRRKKHLITVGVVLVCCLVLSGMFCGAFLGGNGILSYPLEGDISNYNPYVQQTDAFLKGQLHLDVPVPDALASLENPYDPGEREGIFFLWDRAMYNGQYYSYFGIAPILNIYLPHYALHGTLPCESTVLGFYAMSAVFFLGILPVLYVILYRKKISVSLLCGGMVALILSSGVLLVARGYNYFYYIATVAGIAYLSAFLVFLLLAVHNRHRVFRPILFALAGLSFGMLFLSRMNMALLCAFLVVPVLWFCLVRRKNAVDVVEDASEVPAAAEDCQAAAADLPCGKKSGIRWGALAIDLAALGIFVVAAMVFTFWYNHARFGSIFEFGTSYQLTVSDVSQNTLRLGGLPATLYHYFFQPLEMGGAFPFFSLKYSTISDYGTYVYVDTGMGLFSIPLAWGLLAAIPFFRDKTKTAFAKWSVGSLLFGMLFVAWMDFCLGGVIFRYTFDIAPVACILSLFLLFSLCEEREGKRALPSGLVGTLFGLSAFVMLCLICSVNGNLTKFDPNLFAALRSLFCL